MIKGIDNQIMIQRTVDYGKQASGQVASVEEAQAFAKRMEEQEARKNMQSVVKNEKTEHGKVHDRDERERQEREKRKKEEEEEQKKQEQMEILDDMAKLRVWHVPKGRVDIEI